MKPAPDLTPRQSAFVAEYLIDLNATQAAIRAGYSARTAVQQAHRLLMNVHVAAAVMSGQTQRSLRTQVTADSVVQELAKIGFANMLDYIEISLDGAAGINLAKLSRDQAAAIVELTTEDTIDPRGNKTTRTRIKLGDKRAALVDLGKHLGLFRENNTAIAMVINISADDAKL